MIERVLAISRLGFIQLVRSRLYLSLIVAGLALVATAFLLDRLSGTEAGRGFVGIGLAFSSLVVAIVVGVTGLTSMTREIETGQIHLLVGRPIRRAELVLGRFLTLAGLAVLSNLVLGVVLALVLATLGGEHPGRLFFASLFVSFEAFMIAGVALFFGVGSSSTVSALFVVTAFVLGRLSPALYALIETKKFGDFGPMLEAIYVVLPHLDQFDLTTWVLGGAAPTTTSVLEAAGYAVLYTCGLLGFGAFRLEKRDLL